MLPLRCVSPNSIAEWKLRTKLEEKNETVPDQKGKPTKRPTMGWIFFNFQGITELITQKQGRNRVRNIEYGGSSLEDIESHGRI